jgi:hypothetical protein
LRPGHEGVGQAVGAQRDRDVAGQRGIGDFRQRRNLQRVALAELSCPIRAQRSDPVEQPVAARKLNGVALAVIKPERLDARETRQRPDEAGRGILSAGEQDQRGFGLHGIAHLGRLSIPRYQRQPVENGGGRLGSMRDLRHKG